MSLTLEEWQNLGPQDWLQLDWNLASVMYPPGFLPGEIVRVVSTHLVIGSEVVDVRTISGRQTSYNRAWLSRFSPSSQTIAMWGANPWPEDPRDQEATPVLEPEFTLEDLKLDPPPKQHIVSKVLKMADRSKGCYFCDRVAVAETHSGHPICSGCVADYENP